MLETTVEQPNLEILLLCWQLQLSEKLPAKIKPLQKARNIVADSSCISSNGELSVVTRHNVNSSPKQRKE